MARELDPTPDKKQSDDSNCVVLILHGLSKQVLEGTKHASYEDLEDVLRDRPGKFSSKQLAYRDSAGQEKCGSCWHFFKQVVGRNRTVCEVLRPSDGSDIDPEKLCDAYSEDGVNYPLMKEFRQSSKGKSEKKEE